MTPVPTRAAARSRALRLLSVGAVGLFAVTACGSDSGDAAQADTNADAQSGETVTVEDDHGTHEISPDQLDSVGAFDNRTFRTLQEFGVELSVAPVDLMNDEAHSEYINDDSILNTGNHREPDLEQIVAAEPDLVINGQRYAQYYDDIAGLIPEDSVILEFDEATRDAFYNIGMKVMENSPTEMFAKAIISGWLVATMVWMFPAAGPAKIVVIILMTWLIAAADTTHIIVGTIEILYLVFTGALPWQDFFWPFALPTLAGNICGGTFIFALLSHAQIRNDMSNKRKAEAKAKREERAQQSTK